MSLTVTIAGTSVQILENSFSIDDEVDVRSTCGFTVRDDTGLLRFKYGQPVSVVDSSLGTLFAGYIQSPVSKNQPPNTTNLIMITCMDCHYLADKRQNTNTQSYNGWYAGDIATDMLSRYLAAEGVTAQYASRNDDLQTAWAQGTLSGTIATANNNGDLELAQSGTDQTITYQTTSDFASCTLQGMVAANNSLTATPTSAIKFVAVQSLPNAGNTYTYMKIWNGSQTISSSAYFNYDIWIDPSSPQATIGIDVVFTDGTTWRDTAVYYDQQYIPPHPKNDLTGLATGQWYSRAFFFGGYSSKTIQYVSVACEGDSAGTYTAWFRNVNISQPTVTYFFQTSLNTSQQLQNNGYSSSKLTVVNTYNIYNSIQQGQQLSAVFATTPYVSVNGVGILQNSYIQWVANQPTGLLVTVSWSLDNEIFWQCTNNAALPNLIAGTKLTGTNIYFLFRFLVDTSASTVASPEVTPSLSFVQVTLNSAPNATKNDEYFKCAVQSDWTSSGTLSNLAANSSILTMNGYTRFWDDGNVTNQDIYTVNAQQFVDNKTFILNVTAGDDARSRMTFAGQWGNFTCEVDVNVSANSASGIVYRTTNWNNANNTFAYSCTVSTTQLLLNYGSNSGSSGTATTISSVALTLSSGNWHRLKIAVNGTTHKIYLDDVLLINVTDSHFTAAGYIGLRTYNGSSSAQTGQFDNFGVDINLSLSGTWTSTSISLATLSTYGNSIIAWRDRNQDDTNCTILVQTSINGGSTYTTVTNGGVIPGLTVGQSLAGVSVIVKITLTTTTASSMPGIDNLIVDVLGGFSSSGTRISPSLSLSGVGRAGSTLISWIANTPTNTSVALATSTDGGTTWFPVANGGSVFNITTQPSPVLDVFTTNTSANYTNTTFGAGGETWTFDTANSRLIGAGSSSANNYYQNNLTTLSDGYIEADFDTADNSGLACRILGGGSLYALYLYDNQATTYGFSNKYYLYAVSGYSFYLLSSGTITFTRGHVYRFRLSTIGTTISVTQDGQQICSVSDSHVGGTGKVGLLGSGALQCYSIRIQPLGQPLAGVSLLTKATLTSTDPTVTPALETLIASVRAPGIQNGVQIASTDYYLKSIADILDDLKQKSNSPAPFWWLIDSGKNLFFQTQNATSSPWVLSQTDILVRNLQVDDSCDLYRNTQYVKDAIDNTTIVVEPLIGDGSKQTFTLRYPVDSVVSIVRSGVSQTIGEQGATGDQWYYSVANNTLTQDTGQVALNVSEICTISYYPQIPYTGFYQDTAEVARRAAVDGTSGIVENVVDGTGMYKPAADAYAQSLVQRYENIGPSVSFDTMRNGLAPGQLLTCFIPQHQKWNQAYLILKVSTTISTKADGTLIYWYSVEASQGPNLGNWTKMFAPNE